MNIRLSCYANRRTGKNCWTVEKQGKVIRSKVFKFKGDNIKENALECVLQGLRAVTNEVKHEDTLWVEIQNIHLAQWLSGQVEYKDYSKLLDQVFEVLENTDCRYMFIFEKSPKAKLYGALNDFTKQTWSSADSLLDMEENE